MRKNGGIPLISLLLVCFIIVIPAFAVGISGGNAEGWKFRSDNHNSGVYDDGGTRPASTLRWNYTTGGVVESSPAIVDGIVYIGSSDTKVYALDEETGGKIWDFTTDGEVRSSPAVKDGVVYVGSEFGTILEKNTRGDLYALDATTGAKIWNVTFKAAIRSSPAVIEGVVYVGCYDDNFYAFDTATGAKIWSIPADFGVSSPAVSNGTVYIGGGDGMVYALNATDGSERWNFAAGGWIDSSPAVANSVVYIGSWDKKIYALNAATGNEIWQFSTGDIVTSSPAVKDGVVYIGSSDKKVYALDAANGTMLWNYPTGSYIIHSSPAVANGVVYIGSLDYNIYALDAATGAFQWSYKTRGSVVSSPAVADGTVYVGSNDHNVYAIGGYPAPQPPASVTNLHNTTYEPYSITWAWTDPSSDDFDHVMVYLGGMFQANVTRGTQEFMASGLSPDTSYTIGTRTVGTTGLVNQTWVNQTTTTKPDSGKFGSVYVYTTPSNATISIDGIARGYTNQLVSNVPAGTRNLTLTKSGYQTKTIFVNVPAGNVNVLAPITLQPGGPFSDKGTIWVYSTPSNAAIYIDGIARGYTNQFVYNVTAGTRNLTLIKPGYQTKTIFVDVPAGNLKVLAPINLKPI